MFNDSKVITLQQAKSMFTSRSYKDGFVTIEWLVNNEPKSKRYKKEAFYQIGRFHNALAIELAGEAGFKVNELSQYNLTGDELKAAIDKIGGVDIFCFLTGVKQREVEREINRKANEVKPMYSLVIKLMSTKRNYIKVQKLAC